ncbi:MAG: hypothetical protein GF311_11575 [Candidatus Lokiarchaeota archaeon]|jgi:NitT/TauT family transport system substrate-binding protein|nr:hypothetical protein [Candidatus Lokiarchaeota archaeon]
MVSSKTKLISIIALIIIVSSGIFAGIYLYQIFSSSPIKLGALSGDLHHLPLFVALENHYFEDEDLDIQSDDIIWFPNGNEAMVAFEAGRLDMSYLGLAPAMAHKLTQNAPIKVVSGVNVNGSAIMVRDDPLITNIANLSNIAVPSLNNMQDFILQIALNNSGISVEEVNRPVLSVGNMENELNIGSIDGFVAWEPFNAKAADTVAKYLYYSSEIWPNHPCCVIASSLDFMVKESEVVEKIIRIHKKAVNWMKQPSNLGDLINIAKKYTSIQENSIIETALDNIGYIFNFSEYQSQINVFYDRLVELNDNINGWSEGRSAFFYEFLESRYLDS